MKYSNQIPALAALAVSAIAHAGDTPADATPFVFGETLTGSTVGNSEALVVTTSDCGTYFTGSGPDAFHSFSLAADTVISLSLCGSAYDTDLSVHAADTLALMAGACDDDSCGPAYESTFSNVSLPAGDYIIRVGGWNGDTGSYTLNGSLGDPCDRDPLVFNVTSATDFINQIGPGLADLCPGDIINWGPGVYNWGYTISLAANGVIHRGSVDANGNPTTIITGDNQRQCLTFFGVEVYENMIFENGVSNGDGGAFILNPGFGKVTFRNCVFRNNTAGADGSGNGGAVCNLGSQLGSEFIDCLFINNSGIDAGGCFAFANGADGAIFTNCEFVGNTAQNTGGGICTAGGSPTTIGCVFRNNNAASGGGIYINNGDTATVGDTSMCGNTPNNIAGPGTFNDLGGNDLTASCDANDCNGNGIPDADEIAGGADDCDANGVLDECEVFGGDCDGNGVLDVCETLPDCDADGVSDCEAIAGGATDCDEDGVPDSCTGGPGIPDTIATAEAMDANSSVTGSTACANEESTWTCGAQFFTGTGPDVFYSISLPTAGTLSLVMCDSDFDTDLSIHATDGTLLYCDDDSCGAPGYQSTLQVAGIAAGDYIIRIGGWNEAVGNYVLDSTYAGIIDCNGNGTADADDIANGSSDDVNSNDIPDECEGCVLPELGECAAADLEYPGAMGALTGNGVACPALTNYYYNAYNAGDIASGDLALSCISAPVFNGDPDSVRMTLTVLDSALNPISDTVEFCGAAGGASIVDATFATPVAIPAGSDFLVELYVEPTANGGFASFATTDAAVVTQTLVLAEDCGLTAPTSLDDIGFPDIDWGLTMSFIADDEPCTADLNGDGQVDFSDLLVILDAWESTTAGDANGDGVTNFSDLLLVLDGWGAC
ncbi:MAG: hypothetical protein VX104_00075 [Planctomycetota bacterium]|nr:hypothetical protein [Planctomycetota bacterium]